ncbi:MAG TPA: hypothetical protein VKU62_01760, partial [Thermoanaerobaculia bacterium]|nr:hypothetical protein [Thermoanaerobaculia bacterium]
MSEDEVAALASSIIEAKQDEVQAHAPADAIVGGAAFDEDDEEEEDEEEGEEIRAVDEVEVSDEGVDETETVEEIHTLSPMERADIEAEAAHEEAVHAAETRGHAHGDEHEHEHEHGDAIYHHEGELQNESIAAAGESGAHGHAQEDDSILLPGETRSPRAPGAPRENFAPRDSARIGSGNPRSRFQRPFRSGGQ